MMKKKIISMAVLAGIAGSASAVNVNPDGLGQVLLYPYYTVQDGNKTLVSIVNTMDEVKAVKIRFSEGKATKEVLDFNIYLSPYDVWVGEVSATEEGAKITTPDNSCTAPAITASGEAFRTANFTGGQVDGAGTGLDRTREGHIEVIEMGVVTDVDLAAAATHGVDGLPGDCGAIVSAFTSGIWAVNTNTGISAATGGIFGGAWIVNVENGTDVSYNATSLDAFWFPGDFNHNTPGSEEPNLGAAAPQSVIFDNGTVVSSGWLTGRDAVSASLMHDAIMNEYLAEESITGGTDWVVSFPTKSLHVSTTAFSAPFTKIFSGDACLDPTATGQPLGEVIDLAYWDREEAGRSGRGIDFSPAPAAEEFQLCWETNVITFNDSDALGSVNLRSNLNTEGNQSGWARMGLSGNGHAMTDTAGLVYHGLPVTGFAAMTFLNDDVSEEVAGVISNYGNLFNHRASRLVTAS